MTYSHYQKAADMMIGFTTTGTHITASGALRDGLSYHEAGALDAPIFTPTGSMISHTSESLGDTMPLARCVPTPGWHEPANL